MPSWITPRIWTTGERVGQSKMNEISNDLTYLKDFVDAIYLTMFPVTSLYFTKTNVNPGTFLGGTWVAYGSGRVLVCYDAGQAEFDVAGETGSAKTHTLSAAEMPPHTHTVAGVPSSLDATTYSASDLYGIFATATINTGSAGSGSAHNNLQPYIVGFMWERTA